MREASKLPSKGTHRTPQEEKRYQSLKAEIRKHYDAPGSTPIEQQINREGRAAVAREIRELEEELEKSHDKNSQG